MPLQTTIAEINLSVFDDNIKKIKSCVNNAKTVFVVKANAYGHGSIAMSHAAIKSGVDCLAVATVNEGVVLRENGIVAPILILFEHSIAEAELVAYYKLIPILTGTNYLERYNECCKRYNRKMSLYIKVDTGLNRMGVRPSDVLDLAKKVLSYDFLEIEGISTHFASSDSDEEYAVEFTKSQISKLKEAQDILLKNNIEVKNVQSANSGGTLYYKDSHFNMVRFGLLAYGYSPNKLKNDIALKPIMSLKTKVLVIKSVKKGETVSYGMTHKVENDTNIAVLPIGYSDGFSRLFSNSGSVKIKGKYYPIIGRICMDQTIVDIGHDNINLEDEVLIFGDDEILNAHTLAESISTIPYEILSRVGERVYKVYI